MELLQFRVEGGERFFRGGFFEPNVLPLKLRENYQKGIPLGMITQRRANSDFSRGEPIVAAFAIAVEKKNRGPFPRLLTRPFARYVDDESVLLAIQDKCAIKEARLLGARWRGSAQLRRQHENTDKVDSQHLNSPGGSRVHGRSDDRDRPRRKKHTPKVTFGGCRPPPTAHGTLNDPGPEPNGSFIGPPKDPQAAEQGKRDTLAMLY